MALTKFLIQPDAPAYTVSDGIETLQTQLNGGASRFRKDVLNSSYKVSVAWTFTRAKFQYFRGFYKSTTQSGAKPFLIDLMIDEADKLTEHEVHFIPGSVKTSQISGHMFKVEAQLEVKPNEELDEGYFNYQVLLYEIYGENMFGQDLSGVFNALEQLVTVDIPSLEAFANE